MTTHRVEEPLTLSGLEEPPRWKYAPVLYVVGALTMVGGALGLVLPGTKRMFTP